MFACLPNTSFLAELNKIREALFKLMNSEIDVIRQATSYHTTRLWRVLYLIKAIVERTPSVFPMFMIGLINTRDTIYQLYSSMMQKPQAMTYLLKTEVERSHAYVRIFHSIIPDWFINNSFIHSLTHSSYLDKNST